MFLKSWRWLIEWPCTFYAPWKLRFRDMTTCYEFTDIDTEIFCPILNFLLARFHRQGQTTSCKVEKEKSMNVLPPCYDACLVRMFGTFIIDELVLSSIYCIMLFYCLKSWSVFLTGAWTLRVFLGLLTLGRVETVRIGARKNSAATMPGELWWI